MSDTIPTQHESAVAVLRKQVCELDTQIQATARKLELDQLLAVLKGALSLAGGWREAIVELEDFCSEPVRLENMIAAADQIDLFTDCARAAIARAEAPDA